MESHFSCTFSFMYKTIVLKIAEHQIIFYFEWWNVVHAWWHIDHVRCNTSRDSMLSFKQGQLSGCFDKQFSRSIWTIISQSHIYRLGNNYMAKRLVTNQIQEVNTDLKEVHIWNTLKLQLITKLAERQIRVLSNCLQHKNFKFCVRNLCHLDYDSIFLLWLSFMG